LIHVSFYKWNVINVVLNKHQIIFEIKMQVQFFKTPIRKLILVKEMNCVYEVTRGFKSVFVSS